MNKLKILEICPFSAGICGVWARVRQESQEFEKLGHEVRIFSSNMEKGTLNRASPKEQIGTIKIQRFDARSSLASKNVYQFDFISAFQEYNPDIVITHLLHPHSFMALELCKRKNIPCYLVTHAPFNVKRQFPLNLLTSIYNSLKVKPKINNFTKIIAITKWEMPYLVKLGVRKDKIVYIPNGIPDEFFRQKKSEESGQVLFLGRIAPVKNLEILIQVAEKLPAIGFSIVGSAEENYLLKLKTLVKNKQIKNITFYPGVYDLKKKIKIIDKHSIFVLTSVREAMPQVLLEALSRGKIVISSDTDGGKEIIKNRFNGFIFKSGDYLQLIDLIKQNINGNKKIKANAVKSSKAYSWSLLIKSYLSLFKK